ncbi:fucolectin-like [Pelobates fuscus]|uniref:fucolectin-like n=1 Tax=Pelobates fuscus TaxID=191477 RepID=UPI002FE4D04B
MGCSLALSLMFLLGGLNRRILAVSTGNVALRGLAVQSSSLASEGEAYRSIDGDTNPDYMKGSCSKTSYEYQPWWTVDLRRSYGISNVTITNQAQAVSTRLQPWAEIHVGDSMDGYGVNNARCVSITTMAAGETRSFACGGMIGRYVTVVIPNRKDVLTMCEVQVTAIVIPERQFGIVIQSVSDSGETILQQPEDRESIIQQVLYRIQSNVSTLKWGRDHMLESANHTCIPLSTISQ